MAGCDCRVQSALLFGFVLILLSITTWMKLVSYAHTNYDIRALKKDGLKVSSQREISSCSWSAREKEGPATL